MRLGGEVHDGVVSGDEAADELGVDHVAVDELDALGGEPVERRLVAGVRELVEHGDGVVGVGDDVADVVRADEPGAAGDELAHHSTSIWQ